MKIPPQNSSTSQSALEAMKVYFAAIGEPEKLRVSHSGSVKVTGKFRNLLDQCSHHLQKTFVKDYKPPNWKESARQAVIAKLEASLSSMMPWYTNSSKEFAESLLSNITHQIENQRGITWEQAMSLQLDLDRSSPRELAMSNAVRVLMDLNQINHPEIEKSIIEAIGVQRLDLDKGTDNVIDKLKEAFAAGIAQHLESHHKLGNAAATFGGAVLQQVMFSYDLNLEKAKKFLHIPATLRHQLNVVKKDDLNNKVNAFVQTGIANRLHEQLGLSADAAKKIAPTVELCMRRYHLDLITALDLAGLANNLALEKPGPDPHDTAAISHASSQTTELGLEDMDKARAIQQVMARDHCNFSVACEVIDRRIAAVPAIMKELPPDTVPRIVNGFQFIRNSAISDESKEFLRENIISLKNLPRTPWQPQGSSQSIDLPSVYLQDSVRTLRIALHENQTTRYFDSRNADTLTDSVYKFAGDDCTMQAICDSVNQTIKATVLEIIYNKEQRPISSSQLMLHPSEGKESSQEQLSWNIVTKDGRGNLIVRNIFLQKHIGIIPISWPNHLAMNQGSHWEGDVCPANAGLIFDFSYAFKLSDLKKGIREPKILDCHYSVKGSLDWDSIDSMLASSPPS